MVDLASEMCMMSGLCVVTYVRRGWKLVFIPPLPMFQWLSLRFLRVGGVDVGVWEGVGVGVGGRSVGGSAARIRRATCAALFLIWEACTLRGVKVGEDLCVG